MQFPQIPQKCRACNQECSSHSDLLGHLVMTEKCLSQYRIIGKLYCFVCDKSFDHEKQAETHYRNSLYSGHQQNRSIHKQYFDLIRERKTPGKRVSKLPQNLSGNIFVLFYDFNVFHFRLLNGFLHWQSIHKRTRPYHASDLSDSTAIEYSASIVWLTHFYPTAAYGVHVLSLQGEIPIWRSSLRAPIKYIPSLSCRNSTTFQNSLHSLCQRLWNSKSFTTKTRSKTRY